MISLVNLLLGFALLMAPGTFGYDEQRIAWSDWLSGLLLIAVTFYGYKKGVKWAPWTAALIGIWLQLAPLVFWASNPATYLGDTLIGLFVIAFALLIPALQDPPVLSINPAGMSYNPSSLSQRLPILALISVCWFLSRYLAAYQLGYIQKMWDPVFGDGSMRVITSSISKAFPVSDAGLGAFAYSIEFLMCCKGDQSRWRTMPWMVLSFGFLVIPVGIVSTILIILQPLAVGAEIHDEWITGKKYLSHEGEAV